jgi:hypothetical protein
MSKVEITLPIYWQQSKKKIVLVSLNSYRNWHYHTSNKFKKEFAELVYKQLDGVEPLKGTYAVHSVVYYKRSNCDISNIVPVVEKVLLDALITAGILDGDSAKHHIKASWLTYKDASNPRCVTTITKQDILND